MNIQLREYQQTDYDDCRSLWGELTQHHANLYEAPAIAGNDPGRGFECPRKKTICEFLHICIPGD